MREKLITEFMFYEIWKEYREYDQCCLDVEKKDDVMLAVKKAYVDMMTRTIDGLGLGFLKDKLKKSITKEKREKIMKYKQDEINIVLNDLAENIVAVTKGEKNFNHCDLCN